MPPIELEGPFNTITLNEASSGTITAAFGTLTAAVPAILTGLFITTGAPATATATTHAPTVSYARSITTGGPATATATVHAPSVAYGASVTSGAPATATATVHAPEVAVSAALTTGAPATADATVYAPSVSYGQSITTGSPAQATATVYAPTVNAGASLSIETGAPATCAPATHAPEVSYGRAVVTGAPATASASVLAPEVSYGASVSSGVPATAAASVFAPSVSYGAIVVTGSPASASATVLAPSVSYGQSLTTGAPATATGTALAPTVTTGGGAGITDTYRYIIDGQRNRAIINSFPNQDTEGEMNAGWALYARVKYDGTTGKHLIHYQRIDEGIAVLFNDNKLRVSSYNYNSPDDGSTTLTAGVYGIFCRYDGTNLDAWVVDSAGTVTKEIDGVAASYTQTATSGKIVSWCGEGGVSNGYSLFASNIEEFRSGALWISGNIPSEADGLAILNQALAPQDAAVAPFWDLDPESFRDLSGNLTGMKSYQEDGAPFFDSADIPVTGYPDNFVILRDPADGVPVTYDAGAGALYWAAYQVIDAGTFAIRLATSPDLVTWTDDSQIFADSGTGDQRLSDLVYLGNEAGAHDPFFLFISDATATDAEIYLHTSSDMSTWTADAANPVFTNAAGPGAGVEDFRMVKVGASDWAAFYEQDGAQAAGDISVGVARNQNAVPTGAWTNVNDEAFSGVDALGTSNAFHANPVPIRVGGTVYLYYEVVAFNRGTVDGKLDAAHPPTTFLRTVPVADVFDPLAYTKRGCVTFNAFDKFFANCATREGGVTYLYCQVGPGALSGSSDGIFRALGDPDVVHPAIP